MRTEIYREWRGQANLRGWRLETLLPLLLAPMLLLSGCASSPQGTSEEESGRSAVLRRVEVPQTPGSVLTVGLSEGNKIETAGVALHIPETWHARREHIGGAGSKTEDALEETIIVFSDSFETYTGRLAVFSYPSGVDLESYAAMLASQTSRSEPGRNLLLLSPAPEDGREWYLLRSYETGLHTETALWRASELHSIRSGMDTVYLLTLEFEHLGPVKESSEGEVPALRPGARLMRDALFSHLLKTAPSLEGRYLSEKALRFVSSGIWRWMADYRGGIRLAGRGEGGRIAVSLFPVEGDASPQELLVEELEAAGYSAAEEPNRHIGEFFVQNLPLRAEGAVVSLDNGSTASLYLLPESLYEGPWALSIEIEGEAEDAGYEEELLREPYRIREVQALFERQIYFNRQP